MSESPFPFMDVSLDQSTSTRSKATRLFVASADILRTGVPRRHRQQSRDRRNVNDPTHSQRLHFSQRTCRCFPSSLVSC